MAVYFSTFYAAPGIGDNSLSIHPHTRTTYQQSIEMINMLFQSVERFNPYARLLILTSRETNLDGVTLPFERVNVPVDNVSLMLDRMAGQRQIVRDLAPGDTVLFLDTDILVQADLSHLAADPVDIAVTWRRASLPINGGVLIAHNRGGCALSFFDSLLAILRGSYADNWQWDGDQLALRDLLQPNSSWKDDVILSPYPDLRVRLLHSDVYNYSPPDAPEAFSLTALRDKAIVHFKGHRKRFMAQHFQALMATAAQGEIVDE